MATSHQQGMVRNSLAIEYIKSGSLSFLKKLQEASVPLLFQGDFLLHRGFLVMAESDENSAHEVSASNWNLMTMCPSFLS
jgi:hypothetical protein